MQLACFEATSQNMQLYSTAADSLTQHTHLCVTYIFYGKKKLSGTA